MFDSRLRFLWLLSVALALPSCGGEDTYDEENKAGQEVSGDVQKDNANQEDIKLDDGELKLGSNSYRFLAPDKTSTLVKDLYFKGELTKKIGFRFNSFGSTDFCKEKEFKSRWHSKDSAGKETELFEYASWGQVVMESGSEYFLRVWVSNCLDSSVRYSLIEDDSFKNWVAKEE